MRTTPDPISARAALRDRALVLAEDLDASGDDLAAALAEQIAALLTPQAHLPGNENIVEFPTRQIS
jgi:hypothetical protein